MTRNESYALLEGEEDGGNNESCLHENSEQKTLAIITPVGTNGVYVKNSARFLGEYFKILVVEADEIISWAIENDRFLNECLPDFFDSIDFSRVSGLVGYCSSAPIAIQAHLQGVSDRVLLISGAYFLSEQGVTKTQYERDVEMMMASTPSIDSRQITKITQSIYDPSLYSREDHRYQRIRPFRNEETFRRYMKFLDIVKNVDLSEINCDKKPRCLVWCGTDDSRADPSSSRYIYNKIKNGIFFEEEMGGHYDFVDGNEKLYSLIVDFMKSERV